MTPTVRKPDAKTSTTAETELAVLAWLLEPSQPSVRYRTLTELLGRKESDEDVREAKNAILERGWAKEILSRRRPGGGWNDGESQYRPKYLSTNWMMLVLSDLGLTRAVPEVREACEFWRARRAERRPDTRMSEALAAMAAAEEHQGRRRQQHGHGRIAMWRGSSHL